MLERPDRITLPAARPTARHSAQDRRRENHAIPAAQGLVRQRLNRAFADFDHHRISAVVAIAGFGKTTALAHWAADAGHDLAWWRAGVPAVDPLDSMVHGCAGALHQLDPSRPLARDAESLVARFAQYDGAPFIVIDDFHHVDSPAVAALVGEILEASSARFVVSTRLLPMLPFTRSEYPSVIVGPEQLRLRAAEIEELYTRVYRDPLASADALHLARQTGGLPAAVRFYHQASLGVGMPARRATTGGFGTHIDLAMGPIVVPTLAALDETARMLLRNTAPLELLTPDLCTEVTGVRSEPLLLALVRNQTLSPVPGGFAVSAMVRRFLLRELRGALPVDVFAEQVSRCARASLSAGLSAAAVRAFVLAGDFAAAEAVLSIDGPTVLRDPDLSWAAAPGLDPQWARRGRAAQAIREGRLAAAVQELGDSALLGGPVQPESDGCAAALAHLRRVLRVWTSGDVQPGGCWLEQLRAELRRPGPRPARRPGAADPRDVHVLTAFQRALAGDLVGARALCADQSDGQRALALQLLGAVLTPQQAALDDLVEEAERWDLPWLVRLASGMADPATITRRLRDADATQDPWGALLLSGFRALDALRAGRDAVADCEDFSARCRELDVAMVEAWARAALALAAARQELPEASREAEMAVAFAHAAQADGPLALARAVLGTLRGDAELVEFAAGQAVAGGLGLAPWTSVGPPPVAMTVAQVVDRHAPLALRCFGGFSILVDGVEPAFRGVRPRARELLRLLALQAGSPVHRELVIEALWPQLDLTAGTHNLHVSISSLRTALEPGVGRGASRFLVREGDRYTLLLPAGSTADLVEFADLVRLGESSRNAGDSTAAIAALERAMELYVGEVLPEDGPAEWAVAVRDRFKVRAGDAASTLGELLLRDGRPAEAASALGRSLEIEPYRDATWRLLIRAYQDAGDVASAERAWRAYGDVLSSLGVADDSAGRMRDLSR